jgi:hypothetical protein
LPARNSSRHTTIPIEEHKRNIANWVSRGQAADDPGAQTGSTPLNLFVVWLMEHHE